MELILGVFVLILILYLWYKRSNPDFNTDDETSSVKSQLTTLNRRIANVEKMVKMEATNTARERKHLQATLALQSEQRRFDNIQLSGLIERHAGLAGTVTPAPH